MFIFDKLKAAQSPLNQNLVAMKLIRFSILFIGLNVVIGEKARFDNYRVYSIDVNNDEQLEVLKELENHRDGLLFLIPPIDNQTRIEIVIPPHKFADISELCEQHDMEHEIKIENLQR